MILVITTSSHSETAVPFLVNCTKFPWIVPFFQMEPVILVTKLRYIMVSVAKKKSSVLHLLVEIQSGMKLVWFCAFLLLFHTHYDFSIVCISRSYPDFGTELPFRSILQAPIMCPTGSLWDQRTQKCQELYDYK